ncbi:hypothetical protein [Sphingobacterium chuzhouense]|uniref:XRE family transcriptional regulator n=1 Tax=Sphingobacterium chuzhouense TaxID=1742264 RepID=A0ABR7XR19_9SPHI|nr:hypothetical protein [Sphingobacterium chuzhouense]MBD1421620.1 hypothetical protein [Sphingobacterium chuzhouense]
MKTALGNYLDKNKSNKSKIARKIGLSEDRLNALSNEDTAILYADEFYKILFLSNYYAGVPLKEFDNSITQIFPNRKKGILVDKFSHLSPTAQLFLVHTQPKSDVESAIGMPRNKISKFATDDKKRATASEFINFCDGMNLDILEKFEKLFGKIQI